MALATPEMAPSPTVDTKTVLNKYQHSMDAVTFLHEGTQPINFFDGLKDKTERAWHR